MRDVEFLHRSHDIPTTTTTTAATTTTKNSKEAAMLIVSNMKYEIKKLYMRNACTPMNWGSTEANTKINDRFDEF